MIAEEQKGQNKKHPPAIAPRLLPGRKKCQCGITVSYTHLDVYKRQKLIEAIVIAKASMVKPGIEDIPALITEGAEEL